MSRSRFFGSRSRQRPRSVRTWGGVSGGSFDQSGSCRRTAASTSETVSPSKQRVPVSISYSTTPKDQMSDRLSTGRPRACSGDMYAAVPSTTPACVAAAVMVGERVTSGAEPSTTSAFARPKSRTLTDPPGVNLTFAGFRSRWTIPFSCAASSASPICRATARASSIGIGPDRRASRRASPLRRARARELRRRRIPRARRSRRCADG